MSTYNELLVRLKDIAESNTDVSTVTSTGAQYIDSYRKNVYPLVDINIVSSGYLNTTAYTQYDVDISVLDIRDKNQEKVNDKFWLNDNRHDNWNLTREILKRFQNLLLKDLSDISIDTVTSAEKISLAYQNGLDGWTQTFTITVPDDYSSKC